MTAGAEKKKAALRIVEELAFSKDGATQRQAAAVLLDILLEAASRDKSWRGAARHMMHKENVAYVAGMLRRFAEVPHFSELTAPQQKALELLGDGNEYPYEEIRSSWAEPPALPTPRQPWRVFDSLVRAGFASSRYAFFGHIWKITAAGRDVLKSQTDGFLAGRTEMVLKEIPDAAFDF